MTTWNIPVSKRGSSPRKQFKQWAIPRAVVKQLELEDGDKCEISAQVGDFSLEGDLYVLTSGQEFRIHRDMASEFAEACGMQTDGDITFELNVMSPVAEDEVIEKARREAEKQDAFSARGDEDARTKAIALIVRRQGQPEFRRKLLLAYRNRCAISGCDFPEALEAAHIKPYMGPHTNTVGNGILLRSDLHTLLDLKKLRINPNYTVSLSDELLSTVYQSFNNKKIRLPKQREEWPLLTDV